MLLRHRKNEWKTHKFRDLSWMIGDEFDIRTDGYMPRSVIMIAEYPKTVLFELTFEHGKYKKMFSKAKMYCGDVVLRHKPTGIYLTGKEVLESYDEQQATWFCV